MANPEWLKIKEIFYQTLEMNVTEREEFLSKQDETVRHEILELLKAHEISENFIAEPALIEFGLDENPLIGKKIGGYKLLEIIGTGGMGTVFLAEKEGLEKRFAVKLIKRGMDTDEVLRRFKLERQILARLEHPNIAPLLDGGMTTDGLPFLVMEYVEGKTINRFCDEKNLDTKDRLKLFRQVCAAVSYAHQNLVVHRDIKPSNILVTKDGVPKLLDFGIAKMLDTESAENTATTMQSRMFTPEYAAPEQLNGLPITTVSDVYSLGVVLYELLSGVRPFQSKSRNYQEIVEQILTKEPTRPSSVVSLKSKVQSPKSGKETNHNEQRTTNNEPITNPKSQIPNPKLLKGDLDNIILKSLRKEPERRYESVERFSEDIRRHLAGLPVSATADTAVYRFSKFFQRHKTPVLLGIFVSILIFSVSAVAVRQSIVATRANQKSQERLKEIREVAKSLMNETNDALDKIPGNVGVQKALTERSVALLDKLAQDETNDPTLLVELADAYAVLGRIQNWSFREFDKSFVNIEKALAIYQNLLQNEPENIKIRRKLYSSQMRMWEVLKYTNGREQLFKLIDESIANLNEIARIESESAGDLADLAAVHFAAGEFYQTFNKKAEADEHFRKGLTVIENAFGLLKSQDAGKAVITENARYLTIKAMLLHRLGKTEEAVENYILSAEDAEKIYLGKKETNRNVMRIVGAYKYVGEIYQSQKNYPAALQIYLKGKKFGNIVARDETLENKPELLTYNCLFAVKSAEVSEKLGEKRQAEKYFTDGEKVCRQNISADEDRSGTILEQIEEFYEIARYYFSVGKNEKSVALLSEVAENLNSIVEKNESDFETAFALADTYEKLGDFQTEQKKREYYEKSFDIWKKYSENYKLLPAEIEKMESVKKKLPN